MTGAYQFLKKYGLTLSVGVGATISILAWVIILAGYPEFNPTPEELYKLSIFDFALYATYFLILVAVLLVIGFSVLYVAKNPKESMGGLIGMGVFIVLFLLAYFMGDGTLNSELLNSDPSLLPMGVKFEDGVTQSGDLQMADGLIKFGYIMMLLSAGAMVFSAGRDLMKS